MADEQTEFDKEQNSEAEQSEAEQGTEGLGLEALQEEVERLRAALQESSEQALRAHAESQNTLRRAEKDVEKAHKFGQERLVVDLLPVVDNLERALASIDTQDESLRPIIEGVELTLKSFVDTLKRHNVEAIDPEGQPFDPQLHQAMTAVPNGDVEPNTVLNVFQKGYTLHGRLVRPAMVVVSKAPVEA